MAVFSEITITFTNDWVDDDNLKIKYNDNGVINSQIWTWVPTRTIGFDVTTGSPTATPGETTAINFEAAFDLDNPAGYITTQSTNTVTIQSETEGEDFLGLTSAVANTGTFTVVFSNYTPPFDLTTVDLALTRTPYYISTPFDFDETTKVDIGLKIYDGDITVDEPASNTLDIQKIRPTVDYAEFNTNISNLIRQYFDVTPVINVAADSQIVDSYSGNLKWVKYEAVYTDTTNTIADITGTLLSTDGYGRYSENTNPTAPANQILSTVAQRKVSRDGIILLPFINDSTITSIDVDSSDATINNNHVITSSDESTDYIQYVQVDVSQATTDSTITITFNPSAVAYLYNIIDECRYEPTQILFKNRYGAFEGLTMFKKSNTTINTERKEFVNNYVSSGVYTTTRHQFKDYSIDATESVTVNSGYITEGENDLYREMLESDQVYIYDSSLIPVQVKSSSLEYKTRVNDKLVNYTIDFKYAYWTIQSV